VPPAVGEVRAGGASGGKKKFLQRDRKPRAYPPQDRMGKTLKIGRTERDGEVGNRGKVRAWEEKGVRVPLKERSIEKTGRVQNASRCLKENASTGLGKEKGHEARGGLVGASGKKH